MKRLPLCLALLFGLWSCRHSCTLYRFQGDGSGDTRALLNFLSTSLAIRQGEAGYPRASILSGYSA
jgi:hypothetical protein